MTLTEFLLARIAEDEAEAEDCRPVDVEDGYSPPFGKYGKARGNFHEVGCYYYSQNLDPPTCDCDGWKRRLAECEAKRRIVEALSDFEDGHIWASGESSRARDALESLALPYADHPDYQQEWRP